MLGFDVVREDMEIKRRIGVVPDGLHLFDRLSGEEHLRFVGEVQGLALEDENHETKAAMMASIFEANLALQKGTPVGT